MIYNQIVTWTASAILAMFDIKVMVLLELFALVVRVVTVREEFKFQQS